MIVAFYSQNNKKTLTDTIRLRLNLHLKYTNCYNLLQENFIKLFITVYNVLCRPISCYISIVLIFLSSTCLL
jgi:hypothetical protein